MALNLNNLINESERTAEKAEDVVLENTPSFPEGSGRPKPPKMYDKDGNEVTGRPEEGVTYYDKDGNELKMPEKPAGHGGPGLGKGPGGPGFGKGHGGPGPKGHGGPGFGGHGHGEPPKMYDKDGNEVTGRPEEGVTYYDKDGNELKKPE